MAKTQMTIQRSSSTSIVIGTDHRGYRLKNFLVARLHEHGYTVQDMGTHSARRVDYPDIAKKVSKAVAAKDGKGILICGSGIGMEIAANKVPGIRAANAWTPKVAVMGRRDDDTNVLCLPNDLLSQPAALRIMMAWLKAPFGSAARYRRRRRKIAQMERRWRA